MAHDALHLPAIIVSPADLARAKRDLDGYIEQKHQAHLRAESTGKHETIHAGRVISELAALNEYDLDDLNSARGLLTRTEETLKLAPYVTISFAVDPSSQFMGQIVDWLRSSIHPQVLVRIGLQPNITAGCVLKTGNKIYDFSLRQRLVEQRSELMKQLYKTAKPQQPAINIAAPTVEGMAAS